MLSSEDPSTSTLPTPEPAVPLSKNAQKRLVKAAKRAEQKAERRAREKELKKAKKRARAEALEEGDDAAAAAAEPRPKRVRVIPRPFDARIVIDLDFDDMMSEKECASLGSQMSYTYSAQRRSPTPFTSLVFSSLGGKTKTRLDTFGQGTYKRWKHVQWWDDGYERLWNPVPEGETVEEMKSRVVYLTADTDNEISELEEGKTYIIGGIVDHNRYKNLCLNKAKEQGISTARLPIGTYLAEMKSRKVLTVNQCYDILLRWVETRDWEESIRQVMPKRKMREGQPVGDVDEAGEEDEDEEEAAVDEDRDEADEEDAAERAEVSKVVDVEPDGNSGVEDDVDPGVTSDKREEGSKT